MATTQHNETANRILDVAEQYTQTRGFNAFSYKDIQKSVGVKTSSIHYYFPTKQDLALAMVERYIERFSGALAGIDQKYSKASDRLKAMGQIFVDVAREEKLCLCGMLTSDILSLPQEGIYELRLFFKDLEKWIMDTITKGIEDGDIKSSIQAETAALHLLAALEGGGLIARTRREAGYMSVVLEEALSHLVKG
ncbi:MAG: TetR/AcrR family transcriptional regulator [Methyloligellaceae bacterium]